MCLSKLKGIKSVGNCILFQFLQKLIKLESTTHIQKGNKSEILDKTKGYTCSIEILIALAVTFTRRHGVIVANELNMDQEYNVDK